MATINDDRAALNMEPDEPHTLDGLVSLLDAMQDYLVDSGQASSQAVFGFKS